MTAIMVAPPEINGRIVRNVLETVHDPEIPTLSIVDLGLVERVVVTAEAIEVELLPTFVGCPALEVIKAAVEVALAPLGREARVSFTWRVPWTSDRITPRGRARLAASGFAPPAEPADVRCPYCQSTKVAPFEAFKPI